MILIRYSGNPYCIVNPRFVRLASQWMPRGTLKKKLMAMYALAVCCVRRWVDQSSEHVAVFDALSVEGVQSAIAEKVKADVDLIFALWCRDYNRRRVYMWLRDENNRSWFAKIGEGKKNAALFKNDLHGECTARCKEFSVLIEMNENASMLLAPVVEGITIPGEWSEVEPLLSSARIQHKKSVQIQSLRQFSWYRGVLDADPSLVSKVHNILDGKNLIVTFSHGDLGSENVIVDHMGNVSLIDFERCADDGPWYADQISLLLDKRHGYSDEEIVSRSRTICSEEDLIFSLAYLSENEFPPALRSLRHILDA